MVTSPPMSPSFAAVKTLQIEDWIEQVSELVSIPTDPFSTLLSPPLSPTPRSCPPLKRKRQNSSAPHFRTMSSSSSKHTRRDTDLDLQLANSPTRDSIATLASASPPIITGSSSGLMVPPPRKVQEVMDRLEDGLDRGYIPGWLRRPIEDDQDFGYQRIEHHAWGESATPDLSDPDLNAEEHEKLVYLLRKVKKIWLNARVCESRGRDENAWCMDVILPLVKLAMRLEGGDKLWLQSVQSQPVDTEFLSSVPEASGKSRLLDRRADFTLSFSHRPSPGFESLYSRLRTANKHAVSHMVDAFTQTTALFSCIEVKSTIGLHREAEFQLSVWMAASLRKKMQLARRVGQVDKSSLVEPCFAIVGHYTFVYFAYMAVEETDAVQIMGPERGLFSLCDTTTVIGIFRTLRLWRNVIKYGRDAGTEGFWGGFMGLVLERLAGDS